MCIYTRRVITVTATIAIGTFSSALSAESLLFSVTALCDAVLTHNHTEIDRQLSQGANPNEYDSNGYTSFHWTIRNNQLNIASLLLKHGADPDLPTNSPLSFNMSPLHLAVFENNAALVRLLIAHNANINTVDALGRTPLDAATVYNYMEIITVLRSHGASLYVAEGTTISYR